MKKQKVLIISEPGSGGVARHVIDLLTNLNKNKFDVFFIYSSKRADSEYLNKIKSLKKNITVFSVDEMQQKINFVNDYIALKKTLILMKTIQPDIVHCHSSKAGVIGRVAAKIYGTKKVFYTPHAYSFQNPQLPYFQKILFINIEKIMSKYFTYRTFNVSDSERKKALEILGDKEYKFKVINNGIEKDNSKLDITKLCEKYQINKDEYIVGNISRLDKQKNPMEFFRIAKNVICNHKNIKFIWIGNGELKEQIRNFICENKLSNMCLLLPYNEETENLKKRFNIFLCTSLYEGYPYVLLDACVNKIPIVCSNVEGNNDIVKNSINGFLYSLGNIKQAEKMIYKVIDDFFMKEYVLQNIDTMVSMIEEEYEK